jgi:hypothetical protein
MWVLLIVFDGRVYWDNITRVTSSDDPLCLSGHERAFKRKLEK